MRHQSHAHLIYLLLFERIEKMKKKFVVVYDAKTRDKVLAFGSPSECAKMLGISRDTIYKYIYNQKHHVVSNSRYYVYETEE
jgi:DNA invertase Pin-like site-specific DNA recombinase